MVAITAAFIAVLVTRSCVMSRVMRCCALHYGLNVVIIGGSYENEGSFATRRYLEGH